MATLTSPFSISPAEYPTLSFLSLTSTFSRSYIRPTQPRILAVFRRRPPLQSDMSVSVPMPPASSLRRDSSISELLLDTGNRAGKGDMLTTDVEEDVSSSSKTAIWKNRYSVSSLRLFGVDLTPDNIAVALVYFVQGVLGISRLAVSFYFKDELHLDPAETAVISGFSSLPWLIKPLYGFMRCSEALILFLSLGTGGGLIWCYLGCLEHFPGA